MAYIKSFLGNIMASNLVMPENRKDLQLQDSLTCGRIEYHD